MRIRLASAIRVFAARRISSSSNSRSPPSRETSMTRHLVALLALVAFFAVPAAQAATNWTEGQHYFRLDSAKRTATPAGTVEVLEVFSYGCPACNQFAPVAKKLSASLPSNAKMAYLPASFNPAEDWPMFQRAYIT